MTPVFVGLGVIIVLAALVAVSAAVPRVAALGVIVVLVGTPFVSDPLPGVLAMSIRLVAAVLAGYLVWIALRRAPTDLGGPPLGLPGQLLIGATALAGGWVVAGTVGETMAAAGPAAGQVAIALRDGSPVARMGIAGAVALSVLALGPVLVGRDILRLGFGLLLLVAAVDLLASAVGGPPDDITELALAVLIVATGLSVAWLTRQALVQQGGFAVSDAGQAAPGTRSRPPDEAHPLGPAR
jgi:hypothetical protein